MKYLSLFLLGFILVCASCRTQRETLVEYREIARTDTVKALSVRADSVVIRDSVAFYIKGDTVHLERWHTTYRDRLRVDTVQQVKVKTEYQIVTETKVQEVNRLKWWQATLAWIGAISIIIGIVILILEILGRKIK